MDARAILMAPFRLQNFPIRIGMQDRLASLLNHFQLNARVFHTGDLCNQASFEAAAGLGYLHVLKQGRLEVETPGRASQQLTAPSLLFFMKPVSHRLHPRDPQGAELVCGSIDFGCGRGNPMAATTPCPIVISLAGQTQLLLTLELLFAEAFGQHCGRQTAMNRLCELVVIHLLRHLMDRGEVSVGPLAGLADPRLAKALNAMHDDPGHGWTLDHLAQQAGMSRARFAVNFRQTVGMTAGDYLTQWRLALAQTLLCKGKPVSLVAQEVGYSGPAALGRVFNARLGMSPGTWLREDGQG